MNEHTFIFIYKSMVRPHVEFANSVRCHLRHKRDRENPKEGY